MVIGHHTILRFGSNERLLAVYNRVVRKIVILGLRLGMGQRFLRIHVTKKFVVQMVDSLKPAGAHVSKGFADW